MKLCIKKLGNYTPLNSFIVDNSEFRWNVKSSKVSETLTSINSITSPTIRKIKFRGIPELLVGNGVLLENYSLTIIAIITSEGNIFYIPDDVGGSLLSQIKKVAKEAGYNTRKCMVAVDNAFMNSNFGAIPEITPRDYEPESTTKVLQAVVNSLYPAQTINNEL